MPVKVKLELGGSVNDRELNKALSGLNRPWVLPEALPFRLLFCLNTDLAECAVGEYSCELVGFYVSPAKKQSYLLSCQSVSYFESRGG